MTATPASSPVRPTPAGPLAALGWKAQIGSTIYITTGVYAETPDRDRAHRGFIGTGANAAAVVVDGSGSGRVFDVTASNVSFSPTG